MQPPAYLSPGGCVLSFPDTHVMHEGASSVFLGSDKLTGFAMRFAHQQEGFNAFFLMLFFFSSSAPCLARDANRYTFRFPGGKRERHRHHRCHLGIDASALIRRMKRALA